jgi:hypothetical protein
MLRVGTYESPDGLVVITPKRLKKWRENFQRMSSTGYRVPMSWDHADNLEDAVPVKMGADRSAHRSAKNTAGLVTDFRISQDGNSAELVIDAEGRAAEQARSNRVFVSPVIFPNWKDGAGNLYNDVITHVDFVDHPVDYAQQPFRELTARSATPIVACAIRMGLGKPISMATGMFDDENDDVAETGDELDTAAAVPGDGDGDGIPNEGDDAAAAPASEPANDPRLEVVIMFLTDLGLNLPEIKTGDDLVSVLYRTASGADEDEPASGDGAAAQSTVVDPGMQAMSLRVKELESVLVNQAKNAVTERLGFLLKTGRCTKHEHDAQVAKLGALRMSVANDGTPKSNDVIAWAESRAGVPVGTFANTGKPKTRMGLGKGADTVVEPPALDTGKSISEERANELASEILGW